MVDIEREIKDDTPKTAATAPAVMQNAASTTTSENTPEPIKNLAPPTASKGEKLFTWGTYSGLNYWLNLASSVVIADYFCNLKGKNALNGLANGIAKTFAGGNSARFEKIAHHAKTILKTAALTSGGWILVAPIKILEDNKRPIVHWLNKKLGVDQTDATGKELNADEIFIDCEQPKQSWLNVLMRRALASAAVVVTGHAINATFRDRAKTKTYTGSPDEDPHGGKAVAERWIVDKVNKGAKFIKADDFIKSNDSQHIIQRYIGLAALDTLFTKITAVIMKITNGAKHAQMPKEIGDDAAPSASDQSIDSIQYVKPEYEDLRKADAPNFTDRVRNEKPTTEKNKKAENFVALTERSPSGSLALS